MSISFYLCLYYITIMLFCMLVRCLYYRLPSVFFVLFLLSLVSRDKYLVASRAVSTLSPGTMQRTWPVSATTMCGSGNVNISQLSAMAVVCFIGALCCTMLLGRKARSLSCSTLFSLYSVISCNHKLMHREGREHVGERFEIDKSFIFDHG